MQRNESRLRGGTARYAERLSLALLALVAAALLAAPVLAQDGLAAPGAAPAEGVPTETDPGAVVRPGQDVAQPLDSGTAQQLQAFHRLGPNDYLRITLTAGETLSFDRRVDAAGNITLPYVGEAHVEGRTVGAVAADLIERFREYYIAPHVELDLLAIGNLQVLVTEEGGRTEVRSVPNGTTLFQLLGRYVSSGLLYRQAIVVRGGEELFQRAVEAAGPEPLPAADLLPPAELSGGGASNGADAVARRPVETAAVPAGVIAARTSLAGRSRVRLSELLADPSAQQFPVDLVQLMRGGRLEEFNLRLRHGDIVFLTNDLAAHAVDTGVRLVAITGVPGAGTYALLPGETLADLLDISAFSETPDLDLRNVVIERRDGSGELRRLIANIDPASGGRERLSGVELAHRDTVRILPYLRQVFVMGEVGIPGSYHYGEQLLAQDYVALAGGATATANLHEVYIVRPQRDLGAPTQQPGSHVVNLISKVRGRPQEGYSILPGDVIFVAHRSRKISFSDVTQALNTVFLGLSWYDRISDNPATTPDLDPTDPNQPAE